MLMQRTVIVNLKHEQCDIRCDRSSLYGNPYRIGRDGTREEVIEKYKKYFYDKIERNHDFRKSVLYLKGKILGCYCKPLNCHCDIIVEYLDKI